MDVGLKLYAGEVIATWKETVSILVLVDVGLKPNGSTRRKYNTSQVSILVLVDVGLKQLILLLLLHLLLSFQSLFWWMLVLNN